MSKKEKNKRIQTNTDPDKELKGTVAYCPAEKKANPKKGNKKKHKQLKSFLIKLGVIAVILFLLLQFVVSIRIIHDNSMYPSVRDGELILVAKMKEPTNNAVILYTTPDGKEHLGRLMAFAGDEIEIGEDSGVSINGNILYNTIPYHTPYGSLVYPYIVERDSYFVLNDYREMETDSRTYGSIPKENVIGVVVFGVQYREF